MVCNELCDECGSYPKCELLSTGSNRKAFHHQLCEGVGQTEVGEVLKSVSEEYSEEFYQRYRHDYVRNVHTSQHKKLEDEEKEYSVR